MLNLLSTGRKYSIDELSKIAKTLENAGADKCKENGVLNVGLLGTKYTMVKDVPVDRLKQNGLTVTTPSNTENIDEIDRIIFDVLCKGEIKDSSREYYKNVINQIIQRNGIKGIILGCTEIEMLIKQSELDIPIFDTTQPI